jgi:hypothetical protein
LSYGFTDTQVKWQSAIWAYSTFIAHAVVYS